MSETSRRKFFLTGLALPAAAGARTPKSTVPLRYRRLGKTGLRVTELGCGCEAVSDHTVLQHAADLGINFFDTARAYEGGNNERVLKAALRARRKDLVVASRSYATDARTVKDHLDTSLKEIGTDYLDIWYFGNKSSPEEVNDEMLAVQLAAQKAGKIRFRGISTHRLHRMTQFIIRNRFDVVQIPYNFAIGTRRDPQGMEATSLESAIAELKRAGIGVVAMKVMAGRWRGRAEDSPLYSVYRQANGRNAAIRWALRDDRVQTTSVRMVDRDEVDENVRAMAGPFSAEDGKILSAQAETIRPLYCRECGSCDGACPKGLPVSDVVRYVMYAEGYGHFEMGYNRFQRLPEEVKAVRCSDCAACAVKCPNGVSIRERLARAQQLFA
jgi:predicted aldo/keto reductase-like oxidoreductase